ncbi:MAG: hypothetical protein ABIR68_14000 [Ilumatobacteraceae bacterium]
MSGFQHLAVSGDDGPRVTLAAGIEMAGCSWSTTSGTAAKVRSIRLHPHAAVLVMSTQAPQHGGHGTGHRDPGEWTLLAGRATIVDPRRPRTALLDPLAAALAGVAVVRIALEHGDQLLGYLRDACSIPAPWQPTSRVLIVVHGDHRLTWRSGAVVEATGAFRDPAPLPLPRRRRQRPAGMLVADHLDARQAELLARSAPCALGLSTAVGPVAVPGWWDPSARTVAVERGVLVQLHALLPGPCSVTLDDSGDTSPVAKIGVMLRGHVDLVAPRRTEAGSSVLAVDVQRVTSWSGFETQGSAPKP